MRAAEREELLTGTIARQNQLLGQLVAWQRERAPFLSPLPAKPRHQPHSLAKMVVPESHYFEAVDRASRRWFIALCTCGAQTSIRKGWRECYGDCGRFFFLLGGVLRVQRFEHGTS